MEANAGGEAAAADRAKSVRSEVGHPAERWEALRDRVQAHGVRQFSAVADEWLALMWCLDQYRIRQAPPQAMGHPAQPWASRLGAAYRGKGNWFATLLALLLDNRTQQKIRSRNQIKGFSQKFQIDLAWPDRDVDPLVCAESKVTGAPGYGTTPDRTAMADWSNRRKELKFSAVDLKLARREQTERIGHWDVWRRDATPKTFMLWAARMAPPDDIQRLVREAEAVVQTYLEGAGIFAWQPNGQNDGYVPVDLPETARVTELDDVLWRIEDEIRKLAPKGQAPAPADQAAPIDPDNLTPDAAQSD
jgi:hypothetical protein